MVHIGDTETYVHLESFEPTWLQMAYKPAVEIRCSPQA